MKNYLVSVLMLLSLSCFATPECVQQGYTEAIGIREASGHNDGKAVEQYLATTGMDKGNAWCAAFVNYQLTTCGYVTPKAAAWSPSWFAKNVIYHQGKITIKDANYKQPRSGDVFGIYFTNKQRVAHVGFIDDWPSGKTVVTVEGNTNMAGSREGDGVYKKYRLKTQIYQVSRWIDDYES
jgi:hypothetical protein